MPSLDDIDAPGVAVLRRSSLQVFAAMVRDPLRALPPAAFDQRMAIGRTFGRLRVYVSDPVLIQEALLRTADALRKGKEGNRVLRPALGDGLLTADGPHWRWQRQTIAPAFQHDKLQALLPQMLTAAATTRDRWLAVPAGTAIDVGHEMMMTTFDIIVETMLSGQGGIDAALVERSVTDYLQSTSWRFAMALVDAPEWLPFPGYRRSRLASRQMRRAVTNMVVARRRRPDDRADLVSLLLDAADPESGRRLADEEITDNILTFIGAGHETTAVALGWTLMLLAGLPDISARVLAEIDQVTAGGAVSPDHIGKLVYTRQVVSEAMRLYPPAPIIARSVTRDIELGGLTIPARATLIVPIYAVHRHTSLWAHPDRFDPDRFAPEAMKQRHRFAYMPFGAGARICIGSSFAMMEAVAVLAVLLKAVTLERVASQMPAATTRVTLRPTEPLMMRVAPR